MKILIIEAGSPRDSLLASGLRQLLDQAGIEHETADGSYTAPSSPQTIPVPAAASPGKKKGRPAGKAIARKAAKTPKLPRAVGLKKVAPASVGDPRLTIRQRVLNILKTGEKTLAQVHAEIVKAGLPASIDTGQHLYLLKRAGLVRFGENDGYILAA